MEWLNRMGCGDQAELSKAELIEALVLQLHLGTSGQEITKLMWQQSWQQIFRWTQTTYHVFLTLFVRENVIIQKVIVCFEVNHGT